MCVERVCWLRGWGSVGGGRGVSVCVLHVITDACVHAVSLRGGAKRKCVTSQKERVECERRCAC